MRLLLVEDEEKTSTYLSRALGESGLRAGTRLELTAKAFSLLSLLARHQGEILSKMMIAEQIWDMNFDSDANVVEVAIKRLRAKLMPRSTLSYSIPFVAWGMSSKSGLNK